jgi:ABC-type antimicrobial peptide transport system permease subunit
MYQKYIKNVRKKNKSPKNIFKKKKKRKENRKINITYIWQWCIYHMNMYVYKYVTIFSLINIDFFEYIHVSDHTQVLYT